MNNVVEVVLLKIATSPLTGTPRVGQVNFSISASGPGSGDIFICGSPNREFEPEYILLVEVGVQARNVVSLQ